MSESAAELKTVADQEDKSRGEGEGEARAEEDENVLAPNPDQMQEDGEETIVLASKNKAGRVQSVFSLVRDQIRGQPSQEAGRMGMLQLVQHVTRQLDRTKVEPEDTSPRTEVQETQEETVVDLQNVQTKEDCKKDECVVILQQILYCIEGLRKELTEELNLLRQESRGNTDKVLRELETRLAPSRQISVGTNTLVNGPPLIGVPRRRILRRTLTTVTPKTSTAQAFRPRCMSEPVGGRTMEIVSNGTLQIANPDPLLPSLVVTQHAKKAGRSKPRVSKPAA